MSSGINFRNLKEAYAAMRNLDRPSSEQQTSTKKSSLDLRQDPNYARLSSQEPLPHSANGNLNLMTLFSRALASDQGALKSAPDSQAPEGNYLQALAQAARSPIHSADSGQRNSTLTPDESETGYLTQLTHIAQPSQTANSSNREHEAAILKLRDEKEELRNQNQNLRADNGSLTTKKGKLRDKNKTLQATNANLQQQLDKSNQKLKHFNYRAKTVAKFALALFGVLTGEVIRLRRDKPCLLQENLAVNNSHSLPVITTKPFTEAFLNEKTSISYTLDNSSAYNEIIAEVVNEDNKSQQPGTEVALYPEPEVANKKSFFSFFNN
jgi:hypothetical protein